MPGGAVACDLLLPVHICGHNWRIYPSFFVKTKRILDLCLEELSHVIYYYMFTSVVIVGGFIQLLLLSYLVYTSAKKRLKCEERSSLKLTVINVFHVY
jgi:hypothetical protein